MRQFHFFIAGNGVSAEDKSQFVFKTSASLNYQPKKGEFISGRLLHDQPRDNKLFYYKVIDVGDGTDVFIIKTGMIVGNKYRRKAKIVVKNSVCTCLVLRPILKHKPCTRTRPPVKFCRTYLRVA